MKNNPTSKQVQTVIDNFKKVLPMANFEGHLNMMCAKVDHTCKTPMCHAGWYSFSKNLDSEICISGYEHLSIDLGFKFDSEYSWLQDLELIKYLDMHPEIWGNDYGSVVFSSEKAFGPDCNSLQDIVTHWEGVRDRLRALEESHGIFLWDDSRSVVSVKKEKGNPPQPGDAYPERKPLKVQIHELILN